MYQSVSFVAVESRIWKTSHFLEICENLECAMADESAPKKCDDHLKLLKPKGSGDFVASTPRLINLDAFDLAHSDWTFSVVWTSQSLEPGKLISQGEQAVAEFENWRLTGVGPTKKRIWFDEGSQALPIKLKRRHDYKGVGCGWNAEIEMYNTGGKRTAHSMEERLRRATAVLKAFSPLVGDSNSRFIVEGEELLFEEVPNSGFRLIDRTLLNAPNQVDCSVRIMVEDLPLQSVLEAFSAAIHAIGATARVVADFAQTTESYLQWVKNVPERPGYYESIYFGCFKSATAKFVKSGGTNFTGFVPYGAYRFLSASGEPVGEVDLSFDFRGETACFYVADRSTKVTGLVDEFLKISGLSAYVDSSCLRVE